MWHRRHAPYRGEVCPKYPRPRRQVRNLRREKIQDVATLLGFVGMSVLALVGMLLSILPGSTDLATFFILLFVFILGTVLSLAVADATRSVNKFRRGYDHDVSEPEDQERREVSDR